MKHPLIDLMLVLQRPFETAAESRPSRFLVALMMRLIEPGFRKQRSTQATLAELKKWEDAIIATFPINTQEIIVDYIDQYFLLCIYTSKALYIFS